MKLRETFGLSRFSIEQTQTKLDRIVRRKTRDIRKRLFKKLDNLINDKKKAIMEKKETEMKEAERLKKSSIDKQFTTIAVANLLRKSLTFSRWD